MDKPVTLTVKQWIIRNMSTKTMVQERIIEAVINHQCEGGMKGLERYDSLEFSGWGKFYFNRRKALQKLEKYRRIKGDLEKMLSNEEMEKKRHSVELKIEDITRDIGILELRMTNGHK
jgi:hypothetical protein